MDDEDDPFPAALEEADWLAVLRCWPIWRSKRWTSMSKSLYSLFSLRVVTIRFSWKRDIQRRCVSYLENQMVGSPFLLHDKWGLLTELLHIFTCSLAKFAILSAFWESFRVFSLDRHTPNERTSCSLWFSKSKMTFLCRRNAFVASSKYASLSPSRTYFWMY